MISFIFPLLPRRLLVVVVVVVVLLPLLSNRGLFVAIRKKREGGEQGKGGREGERE